MKVRVLGSHWLVCFSSNPGWLLVFSLIQITQDGIGNMKITPGGIQLNGDAMMLDSLMTSSISSKKGQPLIFESSQNVTLTARDSQGRVANRIFLGNNNPPYWFKYQSRNDWNHIESWQGSAFKQILYYSCNLPLVLSLSLFLHWSDCFRLCVCIHKPDWRARHPPPPPFVSSE